MTVDEEINVWDQIVTKAWQDDKLKNRLLAEPAAVFQEFGLEVPAGVQLRVVENTDQVVYLTLPAKPQDGELTEEDLENVAGGFTVPVCRTTIFSTGKYRKPLEVTKCVEGVTPEQRASGQY